MKSNILLAVVVYILIANVFFVRNTQAFGECPPGTYWSDRYWQCLRNRMPLPPPPDFDDPYLSWEYPYMEPPQSSCDRTYENCLLICAGVTACVNNCNIGYNICREQHDW